MPDARRFFPRRTFAFSLIGLRIISLLIVLAAVTM